MRLKHPLNGYTVIGNKKTPYGMQGVCGRPNPIDLKENLNVCVCVFSFNVFYYYYYYAMKEYLYSLL